MDRRAAHRQSQDYVVWSRVPGQCAVRVEVESSQVTAWLSTGSGELPSDIEGRAADCHVEGFVVRARIPGRGIAGRCIDCADANPTLPAEGREETARVDR